MAYDRYFVLADDVIRHLNGMIGGTTDTFISSRYTGFIAISAVTVYELSIKDIFCEFGSKKHKVLGNFTEKYFERINGRIKIRNINEYIKNFGEKYVRRFQKKAQEMERISLRDRQVSIISSYENVIIWRNSFVHEGRLPITTTYNEMTRAYEAGKEVLRFLSETMNR